MKFLSIVQAPKLSFTRTNRKAIVDEAQSIITLYEATIKIEITIPSIWQGIKDAGLNLFTKLFMPKLYAMA